MKDKNISSIVLIVISIILLVATSIAMGFYEKIIETGFNPDALFLVSFLIDCSVLLLGIQFIGKQ